MNRSMRQVDIVHGDNVTHELVCIDYSYGNYYEIHSTYWKDGRAITLVDSGLDVDNAFNKFDRLERKVTKNLTLVTN